MIFLLCSALFLIPLIMFIPGYTGDPRLSKEIVTLLALAVIAAWSIYAGRTQPIKNRWILAGAIWPVASIFFWPKIVIPYGRDNIAHLWAYKSILTIWLYLFAMQAMAFCLRSPRRKWAAFQAIIWSSFLCSVYMLFQTAGIDPWLKVLDYQVIGVPLNPRITGTLGNYTLAGYFGGVAFVLAAYLKAWKRGAVIGLATVLSGSDMAVVAVIISLIYGFCMNAKTPAKEKVSLCFLTIVLIGTLFACLTPAMRSKVVSNNGRFNHWCNVLDNWSAPQVNGKQYFLTGLGPDSYRYVYLRQNPSGWREAHNEPLEILYNSGIIGLTIFVGFCWSIIGRLLDRKEDRAAQAALLCLFLISCGSGIFHFEPFKLIAATLIAALSAAKTPPQPI